MQRISVDLSKTLRPEMILIIYRDSGQGNSNNSYVEVSPLRKVGEDYVPLSAMPLSKEGLRRLKEIVDSDNSTIQVQRQICPSNVLFYDFSYGSRIACWHLVERKRKIIFNKATKLKSGIVTVPKMIFYTNGTNLNVYCYRDGIRPTVNTELYHAPFMNTSQSSVCLGMNTLSKSVDLNDIMNRAEALFFEAPFTHSSESIYKDMEKLWQNALKKGVFPEDQLIKSPKTIQSLL